MTISLKNKTALITGATGQLGRVMARTLALSGADIIVHYNKNVQMADELVAEIKEIGQRAFSMQADITKEQDVMNMAKNIPPVDIVVNNAVIQYTWTNILSQDLCDFVSQFESCIMQSVLTAKAFLPAMKEKGFGRFIGINTECSALCNKDSGAYAAAKGGMSALYKVLAKEVGEYNITVNQVSPGWTISDNDRKNGTEIAPHYSNNIPLGRRGTDQEIANVVLFLASDLSSYVTGINIPVCGGAVMV